MSDLWLLGGQSNMQGSGTMTDVEPPHPNVRIFAHGDTWAMAEEPLHVLWKANDAIHWPVPESELAAYRAEKVNNPDYRCSGLGLPFGKAVTVATGVGIDLLPVAHGGTQMEQWGSEHKHLGGKSYYGAMLRRTKLALATNPETKLKGMLWYQGESEGHPGMMARYSERMIKFVADIRADFGAPDLPVYIVQIGVVAAPELTDAVGSAMWTYMREEQRLLQDKIDNFWIVPALDLDLVDNIHIETPGLRLLGKRLANTVLHHSYGQKNAPTGIDLASVTQEGDRIRVSFANVNGKLIAPDLMGRIPGFGLMNGHQYLRTAFFMSRVDPDKPTDVLLYNGTPIDKENRLVYGYGFFPFCQLIDEAQMAVPAFGPVDIQH